MSPGNSNHAARRKVNRRKVFVIPHVTGDGRSDGRRQVLMVQDRKTREWGFISGGVKRHETYMQAAVRELAEETSGLMPMIPPHDHGVSNFETAYRPDELLEVNRKRGEQVSSTYKAFWVPIGIEFARRLEMSFIPNDEIVAVKVGEYRKFRNRWIVCDMFMDSLNN